MITNFAELIRILVHSGVEFIIIGGAAARAHGSARLTEDLDIVYHRTPENIERLVAALDPFHPSKSASTPDSQASRRSTQRS
jgi:hypothetical protein